MSPLNRPAVVDGHWYAPLRKVVSLGRTVAKAKRLADLHEAREQHRGQFFTPTPVARLMWKIASQAMDGALQERPGDQVAVLDTSIGSGRLVQFADPEKHTISGLDIDSETLTLLGDALDVAGFDHDLLHAGIEEVAVAGYGVALINPPFSLHLESALLEPYSCTAYGHFGPNSSAISHLYALQQALNAADVVVALVPRSAADEAEGDERLRERLQGILHLPGNTFEEEGASVACSILVFGHAPSPGGVLVQRIMPDAEPPTFDLHCTTRLRRPPQKLFKRSAEVDAPTIAMPVTGDSRVLVFRRGQQFGLRFHCGLVEAKVMNALLHAQIEKYGPVKHRYPDHVDYTGQGVLDVELHLMQRDPVASFNGLLHRIRLAGGSPEADGGILPYLEKRVRRLAIESTPTRHWVWVPPGGDLGKSLDDSCKVEATARAAHLVDPKRWGSPKIAVGEKVVLTRTHGAAGERLSYRRGAFTASLTRAELLEKFTIASTTAEDGQWVLKAPGRRVAFPSQAAALLARAHALGLERWLTWGFQLDDLIEASLTRGVVIGWFMGLGKARLATALALLGGGTHNLIVVEAHLLEEFAAELVTLGLDRSQWNIIDGPAALTALRKINLISYTRLRMIAGTGNATYAKRLRNRIHTVIADEGHAIANDATLQVQALYQVSPKRRYAMTGTPIGNYPRNLLPLALWALGDGTAAQPYGRRRPYLKPELIDTMSFAERGIDAFTNKFVTVDWCTYEFLDDWSGGKREIPVLSGVDEFREFAGRLVIRRVWDEPEVAAHIKIPKPEFFTHDVDWDDDHLAMYLAVAEEFAAWWRETRLKAGGDGKSLNMVSVLARIGAVFRAATYPQGVEWSGARYSGRTSKQRAVVDCLERNAQNGCKTILFATSPDVLAMTSRDLQERGIESVLYTGRIPLRARTKALNERFRYGDCSTLLASFGVAQTGINVPQASAEFFYNRCWSPRQEEQALYRALRPQQKNRLQVTRFHLRGSLDEYQKAMVEFKADSARAGLDWGTPEFTSKDFRHWLQILDTFCEELSGLRGIQRMRLREVLENAA